jgi:hypothetical protein
VRLTRNGEEVEFTNLEVKERKKLVEHEITVQASME